MGWPMRMLANSQDETQSLSFIEMNPVAASLHTLYRAMISEKNLLASVSKEPKLTGWQEGQEEERQREGRTTEKTCRATPFGV